MINIKSIIALLIVILILTLCGCQNTNSARNKEEGGFVNYNWPNGINESDKYSVKVTYKGKTENVFTHMTTARRWLADAYPEDDDVGGPNSPLIGQTFSWAQFSTGGKVMVEVTKLYGEPATRVEISPKAYGIIPEYFDGNTVRFTLDDWCYVSVNFICPENSDKYNHQRNKMMIFADPLEKDPPSIGDEGVVKFSKDMPFKERVNAKVIYFEPGLYNFIDIFPKGVILPYPGQTLYLEGGAYINGAVNGVSLEGLKIRGRGIISGESFTRHHVHVFLDMQGASDSLIEGITVVQPTGLNIYMTGKNNIIRNSKVISFYMHTDGFAMGDSCLVEDSFVMTNDDFTYAWQKNEFRNCVFWPMGNGSMATLGWENYSAPGGAYYNNIYLINSEQIQWWGNYGLLKSCLAPSEKNGHARLENIYIEGDYPILSNLKFEVYHNFDKHKPAGEIKDIVLKNIKFEKPFIGVANNQPVKQIIKGYDYGDGRIAYISDVTFINIVVGNTLITDENYKKYFDIDPKTTRNIVFKTEGRIHEVKASASDGGKVLPAGNIPVPEGMRQQISIIPEDGYEIKDVIVDGKSQGSLPLYVFKDVKRNHKIEAKFQKK